MASRGLRVHHKAAKYVLLERACRTTLLREATVTMEHWQIYGQLSL